MAGSGLLSVTELTRMIASTLEAAFPPLWVEGEIADISTSMSGHVYFSLRDGTSQLRAVMFRRASAKLPFTPRDGDSILAFGRISVYEPRGTYQLVVEQMEPRGVGALQAAVARLYEKLSAEGIFATERKRSLPSFPATVGIVTSRTGAAVRDILKVLDEMGKGIRIVLSPAQVQGDAAPDSIVSALTLLEKLQGIDLIIVGRGGGSYEDLMAFSDEKVVRAVADCPVPVISAVGHEIDTSLSDLAADRRAPTPTAAAQIVTSAWSETQTALNNLASRLVSSLEGVIQSARMRLAAASSGLVAPEHRLRAGRMRVDELGSRLRGCVTNTLSDRRRDLYRLDSLLASLGPESVLKRGYAILLKKDGTAVRRSGDVDAGEDLSARLAEGSIDVKVIDTDE